MSRAAALLVALLLALALVTAEGAVGAPTGDAARAGELRVYVSLPRSGANASTTRHIVRGLEAAVAARRGRVAGRPIRLIHLDDARGPRWDARRVRANARRAVADRRAIAYVGELNSEATAVALPILARAGMPMMAPNSTADALTRPRARGAARALPPVLVRPMPSDGRQATALVMYLRRAGVRRVVLLDDGQLYGRGLADGVARRARAAGIRVALRRTVDRDGRDRAAVVRAVAARRPRAVLFAGSLSSGAAPLFRALHARLPRALLFGGDALAHRAFARAIGAAQRVTRLTAPAAHVDPRDRRARRLGRRPDAVAVFAYNGMTALLDAIQRAARRDGAGTRPRRASVRAALFDGTVQRGLSGPWTIDRNGDSTYGVFDALRLRRGEVVEPIEVAIARRLRAGGHRSVRPLARTGASGAWQPAALLQGADIEEMIRAVEAQRLAQLEEELRTQLDAVGQLQRQLVDLHDLRAQLSALVARFPAAARIDTRLDETAGWADDAPSLRPQLERLLAAPDLPSELDGEPGSWTMRRLQVAVGAVQETIDRLQERLAKEMVRLQALVNKRNEALDALTRLLGRHRATPDVVGRR